MPQVVKFASALSAACATEQERRAVDRDELAFVERFEPRIDVHVTSDPSSHRPTEGLTRSMDALGRTVSVSSEDDLKEVWGP